MLTDPLLEQARSLWETLAAAPVSFTADGALDVVASPGSGLCPPSWVGIVALGDSAIVTVPTERMVERVRRALAGLAPDSLTRPDDVRAVLPVAATLGPATLGYVSRDAFMPASTNGPVERLVPGHHDLKALLESVDRQDAEESGLGEITSHAFVVREGGRVVAAAGYTTWPGRTAHLCVMTDAAARGRGLARQVASRAVDQALAEGLLPQWRARPPASRRVAQALGFREMGSQLSVQLDLTEPADVSRSVSS
jgi:GNAT superfamily N-acetyltransferase